MRPAPPLGTAGRPVRVAIVGAGPAGFFTADALLRREEPVFEVDLLDRLPSPFGLVRAGVAPDHQAIKRVLASFEKTAAHGRFRFLGHVAVGRDVAAAELAASYDQVVYAVGSATDRRLGIPGEELAGSYPATALVGWYNAHPDFVAFPFDLDHPRVVVVGVGNVAIDVARILLRDRDELAPTDIAEHALAALRRSRVREVVLLARRGAAQVAFTPRELLDVAALDGVRVVVDPEQLAPDAARLAQLDPPARKVVEALIGLAHAPPRAAPRTLRLELLASPVALLGDARGHVRAVEVERNELVRGPDGEPRARGTGQRFELEAGVVVRSVGYRGVPVEGVPFDADAGVVANRDGRVVAGEDVRPGQYAVGWCRRGPLGLIGTNKADAAAVVAHMIEDVPRLPAVDRPRGAIDELLARRGVRVVSFDDWSRLDAIEREAGAARAKVREKLPTVDAMMRALGRRRP